MKNKYHFSTTKKCYVLDTSWGDEFNNLFDKSKYIIEENPLRIKNPIVEFNFNRKIVFINKISVLGEIWQSYLDSPHVPDAYDLRVAKKMISDFYDVEIKYFGKDIGEIITLETAKKLKETGFNYPTYYYWLEKQLPYYDDELKRVGYKDRRMNHNKLNDFIYSAPTMDDLLEIPNNKLKK